MIKIVICYMYNVSKKFYIIDTSFLDENWIDQISNLPFWRQENINKIIADGAKKLSFLASFLFVTAIRDVSACINPNEIEIYFNKANKPYIKNEKYSNIFFNISHSKNTAVLALSDDEVGCDIETIGEANLAIAKRFFTNFEYKFLESIRDLEFQKKVFYKMWTLKESFTKLKGTSIADIIDKMDFSDVNYERIFLNNEKITPYIYQGDIYYFQNFSFNNYVASICSKSSEAFRQIVIKK